jgi:hypothetical protein
MERDKQNNPALFDSMINADCFSLGIDDFTCPAYDARLAEGEYFGV